MKTNVIMVRKLNDFDIQQRTKDSMFNATLLLNQWNKHAGQQKQMIHFFENIATEEFVETIMDQENFTQRNSVYVKSRARADRGGGTWMHPLLFIDFAMWLNAKFKYHVLKFVYDELIKTRHDAGDGYNRMCRSLATLNASQKDYQKIAKAVNWIVYNKHDVELRQVSTESQLKEVDKLQGHISFMIDMGDFDTVDQLLSRLRIVYHKKRGTMRLAK